MINLNKKFELLKRDQIEILTLEMVLERGLDKDELIEYKYNGKMYYLKKK